MVIVDTDLLIDFLSGDEEIREPIARRMKSENLATTVINQYELYKGADSAHKEDLIEGLIAKLDLIQLDYASIRSAAKIFQTLKKSGNLVPESDILVAGIAHAHNETILTRDMHFKRLPMVKVELMG
jgi:tRNA(fMet)-specific endonuclease VapC